MKRKNLRKLAMLAAALAMILTIGSGVRIQAAESGEAYEELEEDDVVIDNPAEEPEEPQEEEPTDPGRQSVFSALFNSIRNWFNGRR